METKAKLVLAGVLLAALLAFGCAQRQSRCSTTTYDCEITHPEFCNISIDGAPLSGERVVSLNENGNASFNMKVRYWIISSRTGVIISGREPSSNLEFYFEAVNGSNDTAFLRSDLNFTPIKRTIVDCS